jgi:hypothetical protein
MPFHRSIWTRSRQALTDINTSHRLYTAPPFHSVEMPFTGSIFPSDSPSFTYRLLWYPRRTFPSLNPLDQLCSIARHGSGIGGWQHFPVLRWLSIPAPHGGFWPIVEFCRRAFSRDTWLGTLIGRGSLGRRERSIQVLKNRHGELRPMAMVVFSRG